MGGETRWAGALRACAALARKLDLLLPLPNAAGAEPPVAAESQGLPGLGSPGPATHQTQGGLLLPAQERDLRAGTLVRQGDRPHT